MRERLSSAAVLVPTVVVVFLLGQPWLTLGVALVAFLAAIEAFRLIRAAGLPADPGIGVIAAPLAVIGTLLPLTDPTLVVGFVVAVIGLAAVAAFRRDDPKAGSLAWVGSTFGAIYVSLLAFIPAITVVAPALGAGSPLDGRLDPGRAWLLLVILTVWAFDTFAYVVGRTYPRGRFLAHISARKTWSGVIGGTVAAIVVGAVLASALGHAVIAGGVLGLIVAVAGQVGDVAESMLKRAAGAKDSGSLIPGHGGILDRIDSFLFAAPAAFVYLSVVHPVA